MARPKKNAEDKKQAQQVPQVAPQPPQQHMMPQGNAPQAMAYQNMAPQMAMPQMQQQMPRQPQHQFQQFAPQVQMPQQPPPPQMPQQPIPMPQPPQQQQNVSGRFVDGDSFLSVRDSTLTRLTTISALLESLAKDYLRHTSLLLGDTSEVNQEELLNNFKAAAAQAAQAMHINTDAPPPAAHVEEKKERKKRTHDPNAPKRPLTPYFLYMQHARGIISSDLGADAPKGAVQEEGQRRWGSMGVDEKKGWNQAYQYNLRLYNARTASYKQGNLDAKNMTDDEALEYANTHGIREVPPADGDVNAVPFMGDPNDNDAIAQQLQGGVEPALPMPTPASKTPKKAAGSRKRKSEAADDSKAATPAAASAAASPAKRRRSTKAAAADTPTAEETKPKGRGGKKTKSS